MAIQILSPQLANQIAAGEVVERPASVVKELVENSLDAGATTITIDIEKGGSKLIRIRDDGCGIAKAELELALCRHATSKIHQLSDLEQILSLGFRGEALASISSVSRLTLTSRPADQDSAWQAIAEGRDMQVQLRPAAHPPGSSIEVLDLFFNTPARRRFLRSDKTEFAHIDELVKRLALSRYDVNWTLTHNGQTVRQLKAATDRAAQEKRLAQLCGRSFIESALYVESQYDDMRLWGWVQLPHACQAQPACQFSYVNGRMMRDKLLNHAIRQSYGDVLLPGAQPAFVLYLELDPQQLDVNVHPAKHEVRFHQARLVHDFVVSALAQVCQQPALFDAAVAAISPTTALSETVSAAPAVAPSPAIREAAGNYSAFSHRPQRAWTAAPAGAARPGAGWPLPVTAPTGHEVHAEHAVSTLSYPQSQSQLQPHSPSTGAAETPWLAAGGRYAVAAFDDRLWLVDACDSLCDLWLRQPPPASSLLLPLRLTLQATEKAGLLTQAQNLAELGFDLVLNNNVLIVRAVPLLLRQTALSQWLPLWWQQWPEHAEFTPRQLLLHLLQSGLAQSWFSLSIFLNYFAPHLSEPSTWHAVPLDISVSQMLLEAKQ
ncbi:DNA mismatch repair endonuclease MutL [Rheinheimera riviphila]|uniref:DNA mismatch repair protein MutL n=1 Tax=Rheinheimera riviphila TaxID=1834037 RepID=A0A437QFW0_9GAMM|nr:DNA mismatch repair endonuclease MutL [Rheinheimera riviphila]RVU33219.1 DNA mismatch repair endonuclease MutL [Rheinheimera riviphila]